MNKILSRILFLLISTSCFGQKREFRLIEEIPSMSAMFLAGAFNGVSQDLLFHYNEFETTFPNANSQYWDPEISWANKYKNKGYVKSHNHYPNGPDIFFNEKAKQMKLKTGVYYFKKNSGNLIIEDKLIEIKEDDFIVFDSKLNHCSEPNNDEHPRVVFSINMGYKVKTK